jgi:hypothetical protein
MVSVRGTDGVCMRKAASARVALAFALPVMLIAGAVFATAIVKRHAALVGKAGTRPSRSSAASLARRFAPATSPLASEVKSS